MKRDNKNLYLNTRTESYEFNGKDSDIVEALVKGRHDVAIEYEADGHTVLLFVPFHEVLNMQIYHETWVVEDPVDSICDSGFGLKVETIDECMFLNKLWPTLKEAFDAGETLTATINGVEYTVSEVSEIASPDYGTIWHVGFTDFEGSFDTYDIKQVPQYCHS